MTILPTMYAEAFIEATETNPDTLHAVTRNFVQLLDRHGVLKDAERIIRAIEMGLTKKHGGKWIEVEYAREVGAHLRRTVLTAFRPEDHVEERMNPNLVAGVRITVDGAREIDQSLTRRMQEL